MSTPIHVEPPDGDLPDELREILDDELARLPARHRGPVVLCELEGLSRPEAARRLGIPEGTLSSRLSRAKAQLRDRLARRGVALPVAAISAILLREARAMTVPLSLLESTVEAATLVAAGPTAAAAISVSVASLSEGVIKTMLVAKLKGIALAVGTMTAVVSGAVVLAQPGQSGPQPGSDIARSSDPPPVTRREVRRDPDDRTAALEKKLDRVLDALERLSGSRPPAPNPVGADLAPAPTIPLVGPAPRPATAPPPATNIGPEPELAQLPTPAPPPAADAMPAPSPDTIGTLATIPGRASLSDRLQALEQQMNQVQQRLERLEGRLKSLDARVGGVPATPIQRDTSPPPAR